MRYFRILWMVGLVQVSWPCVGGGAPLRPAAGPAPVSADPPSIQIARDGAQLLLNFSGLLQSAGAVSGPWVTLTNAASPIRLAPAETQQFYRSHASAVASIFSARSVVALSVFGPFQQYFELAFAGTPDGIFPPRREKPYFEGTVEMEEYHPLVSLRVRGNSSLQECPFPKLKLKVSSEHRIGTPFFDAREINIGTHCAEGGRGTVGRLRDESATYREALAYEVLELLGFPAPRVRRAQIEYHDLTPTNATGSAGWVVSRHALILDNVEVVAERRGGRALEDEEKALVSGAVLEKQGVTDLRLFHALLGNWDYALPQDGPGLWNTDVIELADKSLIPVAGDFDLASWVTGEVRSGAPREYHPEMPDVEREAQFRVEQIQQSVNPAEFAAGRARFTGRRSAIESQIAAAEIDAPGRTNALRHATAFFEALAAVAP